MLGVIFALGGALFIALAQVALRKSYKEFKPSVGFFFDALFGLALWVPLALWMGVSLGVSFEQAILYAFISAVLSEALYFYALSHGELAVTATVLATYPVYTVIFSRIINDEVLTAALFIFVALAIVGSIVATLPDKLKKSELKLRKEIVWPFVAAIGVGLSDTLSKGYINRSGDFSFLFALGFVQVPVALAYLKLERESIITAAKGAVKNFDVYKQALVGGLFNIIGTGFLWLSFSYAPASVASPITGVSGALAVMFARFVFSERLSARKYFGITLALVGVLGIALFYKD
ncbi:MAG TPA: DMT family transporter [Candidatus Limnocylindria bacterium]|nr:DMT family transporter [Candidatus Limnocylindria bacterium]